MSVVAQRLRNGAKFHMSAAPGERERAAETIDALCDALRFVRANENVSEISRAAIDAALAKAEVK